MNWKATCYPVLIGTLLVCAGLPSGAQTTGFTYQGRLFEGGSPASGSFDLRFSLHEQPELGAQLSAAITNAGVVVTVGLFTTLLDFGAEVFDGGERWLEVAVKPAGILGEFATLTPRQQLSATPYAIKAWQAATVPAAAITSGMLSDGAVTATKLAPGAASQLGTPDETNPSVVAISNDGRVGVGTNSPEAGLHVANTVQTLGLELLSEQVNGAAGAHHLGRPIRLKLSGQLLAVASSLDQAITLFEVTDPAQPVVVAEIKEGDGVFTNLAGLAGIDMSGNILAVAAREANAVTLIDIGMPQSPVKIGEIQQGVGGFERLVGAVDVAIHGDLLAISAHQHFDGAVTLADISDPTAPILLAELRDGQAGFDDLMGASYVEFMDDLLVISAVSDSAVSLIDVSNPASPSLRAVLKNGVNVWDALTHPRPVVLRSNLLAIVSYSSDAVTLVDPTDPTNPRLLSVIRDLRDDSGLLNGPRHVALSGELLAIGSFTGNAVSLVDLSNPELPQLRGVARQHTGGFNHLIQPFDLAFREDVLFITEHGRDAVAAARLKTNEVSLVTSGMLGVGTVRPLAPLHVRGGVLVEGADEVRLDTRRLAAGRDTTASGEYATAFGVNTKASGAGSLAAGFGSIAAGLTAVALGNQTEASDEGAFAAGVYSVSSGTYSTSFGYATKASGYAATALGYLSEASGAFATAFGNRTLASGANSTAFGRESKASGDSSTSMGEFTEASGLAATALGSSTTANGDQSVALGWGSVASGGASLAGGAGALAQGQTSVSLGAATTATGYAAVALGWQTQATNATSLATGNGTLAGGLSSSASGYNTQALGDYSTSFGLATKATGRAALAAGDETIASGNNSFAAGDETIASGNNSLAAGFRSTASGYFATAVGVHATAAGDYSLALGHNAKANHNGSFVWGGYSFTDVVSSTTNEFTARAAGGVRFFSNDSQTAGVSLEPGATAWSVLSDRASKKNLVVTDGQEVLEKLSTLPLWHWNYRWESDEATPHLGPMAQDFKAAFYPGREDRTITTLEFDGVQLAALQGLYKKMKTDNQALRHELSLRASEIASLRRAVDDLKQLIGKESLP